MPFYKPPPTMTVIEVEGVPAPIDTILRDRDFSSGLLRVGRGGKTVLDSAFKTLRRCVAVQAVIPVSGEWPLAEAVAYMDKRGFVLTRTTVASVYEDDPACTREFDCVFERIGSAPA